MTSQANIHGCNDPLSNRRWITLIQQTRIRGISVIIIIRSMPGTPPLYF
ncbi:hypothetical protein ANCCAN_27627 [Ancylostoma caninum]|uniref:Uncharacterized protein n=1 Tax=Ancylostoma caninum TaxID=29170 RepID=A0A368F3H7_ANCCA|nr:hypothetical protein ANCCAN_27627 [Ancylostoma caninum]